MPPLTMQEEGLTKGAVLSLTLPSVRRLLSRSRMCLGRHCRSHPVHVTNMGGCPHMCPWVGPHAPSFGRQLWGLPSHLEYLSLLQGVLLPPVYGTTASLLWLELRGLSAWQATPSWTVYRLACQRLLPWSPMQPGRARTSGLGVPPLLLARWVSWVAPVRTTHGVLMVVRSDGMKGTSAKLREGSHR